MSLAEKQFRPQRTAMTSASASQPETAFNTAEGWARDVTEDIAHAVLDRARIDAQSLTAHRSFWKGC